MNKKERTIRVSVVDLAGLRGRGGTSSAEQPAFDNMGYANEVTQTHHKLLIDGISISGYRSFGPVKQELRGLSKINLLIGRNNSGKSNWLRVAHEMLPAIGSSPKFDFLYDRALDAPKGSEDTALILGIWVDSDSDAANRIFNRENLRINPALSDLVRKYLFADRDGFWFYVQRVMNPKSAFSHEGREAYQRTLAQFDLDNQDWNRLFRAVTDRAGGGTPEHQKSVLSVLNENIVRPISVDLIPSWRSVKMRDEALSENGSGGFSRGGRTYHGGYGIIEELAKAQNPSLKTEHLRARFELVNEFLKTVTQSPSAYLEVPYDRDHLLVHIDGRALPLESLGSGIEELVIIAARSTLLENQLVCLEEPELHLHPALQRELMKYLLEKTSNQYLISTHSAHLIDAVQSSVYHVELDGGYSRVRKVLSDNEKFEVCTDLGYHASDLLQSNSVVWVEGPSDRLYLNWWIKNCDPDLIEGLHYSIMFYGGRLLSHLTASDTEVNDFIRLRRLNRNSAIVIDSDKSGARASINDTKRRMREEFVSEGGYCWITAGREIENYLAAERLTAAVEVVHPEGVYDAVYGRYESVTKVRRRKSGEASSVDKVKVAHEITKEAPDFDQLDLGKRVRELVTFIREANRHLSKA